jgi:hypothetical protein
MRAKRFKRPRDPVQLGELIGDILTGQVEDGAPHRPDDTGKDRAAVTLGRKGGLKGGKARAAKMAPEQGAEIARKAACRPGRRRRMALAISGHGSPQRRARIEYRLRDVGQGLWPCTRR